MLVEWTGGPPHRLQGGSDGDTFQAEQLGLTCQRLCPRSERPEGGGARLAPVKQQRDGRPGLGLGLGGSRLGMAERICPRAVPALAPGGAACQSQQEKVPLAMATGTSGGCVCTKGGVRKHPHTDTEHSARPLSPPGAAAGRGPGRGATGASPPARPSKKWGCFLLCTSAEGGVTWPGGQFWAQHSASQPPAHPPLNHSHCTDAQTEAGAGLRPALPVTALSLGPPWSLGLSVPLCERGP